MEWTGLNELRERYLAFFEKKDHLRLPSAPLVPPQDDASLLLINSGMAPLKKYFLGLETPPKKRVTSCQKCIRTPDIENVGKTSRHGTFFEMLGNFSFGDYFKEEATKWAWEFLTEDLRIPADRLWVSVYEEDDEAFNIWTEKRGLPESRIVRMGKEDNFWEIGSGPCGPCSEIYFDRGPETGCGSKDCAVGCECDRYVEIWNLVFTQFNSDGAGNYTPLEHPNIDTGMGLERLACAMQGVSNLFEVDTMQNIMQHVADISGVTYGENEKSDISLRVVTDHIRSTVFMVSDGVLPQNEGRGYVLRRLLRRAARHGRLLGITEPFLYQVCETVIKENQEAYPNLKENADYIIQVIRTEEERFLKTIEQGMELLEEQMEKVLNLPSDQPRMLSGEEVFRLYDTFGFPLDLTKEIAEDRGISVDEEGFRSHMQEQRQRARKAHEKAGDVGWEDDVLANIEISDTFIGYDQLRATTQVLQIVRDGQLVDEISEGQSAVVILGETPFYAESGGQVGDQGLIHVGKSIFKITDCQKSPTGHYLHIGEVRSGFIAKGDTATVYVDAARRRAIMRNHTAAHLLQAALRAVLGGHIHQAGSYVSDEICRFDFTHFSMVTPEQLLDVEKRVNQMILDALPVSISEMSLDEAKKMGAIALFGDKYNECVRVCSVDGKSVELCGGTHVPNTAHLGLFRILRETSVASGVRRIEAVTGFGVMDYIHKQDELLHKVCEVLKTGSPSELVSKSSSMVQQIRELQKQVEDLSNTLASNQVSNIANDMKQIGSVRFLSTVLADSSTDALKHTADDLKAQYEDIVGVLATTDGAKGTLLVFAGKQAVASGIHAGKLVREIASLVGGSGGGRPDNAMGGIPDSARVNEALQGAQGLVEAMLGAK